MTLAVSVLTENSPAPAANQDAATGRRFKVPASPKSIAAVFAGVCLAASVPPWGFWPFAFLGVALWDWLIDTSSRRTRFARTYLVTLAWLLPAMLWMLDLTLPGFLIAAAVYPLYFGVAAALTPQNAWQRRLVFPALVALAELVRWRFPFGGVPLANLALGQVESPLAATARVGGPYLIIVLVVVVGQGLRSLIQRNVRHSAMAAGVVVLALLATAFHPRASDTGSLAVAAVQGGGPQRTRASQVQNPTVLARHMEATRYLDTPVDLILWPENVVNPGRFLSLDQATEAVSDVARDQQATLLAGWFYRTNGSENTLNYQNAVGADGTELDRYSKVRIVPFGEFVPLRGLIEIFNDEIPQRDVIPGTGPAVLQTDEGVVGVAISWESFFERRTRDSISNGAEILTNPTNGSSYWLTQVQTQQVASNQLRAIEGDRWMLMAGPTGLSAIIDPDGNLIERSDVGERVVLTADISLREGRTLFSYLGIWPLMAYVFACAAVVLNPLVERRSSEST